ncbi:O-antigen ligase family protein [Nocardioides pelophilus]|uniref:O-antigen ligase family protein n=1 Tax=Nocardioides pelophilus TaxID=2172019 RepID=UPI0016037E88|nr:O-antigen ligase family protein [Nocardioides pelophilus]
MARPGRGFVLTSAVLALAAGLAAAATQGLVFAAVTVVAAVYVAVLTTFGLRNTGIVAMVLAFGFAPMYRGAEGLTGGTVPPTDVFILLGILHLLPTFLGNRLKLPPVYVIGLLLTAVLSLVSVIVTGDLFNNAFYAGQWLFFIGALPIVIAWWRPHRTIVVWLLWAYLAGHLISTAKAITEGAVFANRYDGFTHHPNAFGLGGVTSIAIVLFLLHHHKDLRVRVLLLGVVAISLLSVSLSGSRAAIVVLAALVVLIPIVERSALMGVGLAVVGALGVLSIPFVIDASGEETALGRLAGGGTASGSDKIREAALEDGFARLWQSPILGSGFKDVEQYHNVYLEAAVAIGILGLACYLVVMFALARPLFTHHPLRRLTYIVWVFIGIAPTFPGLWDRTVWVPASLAALAMLTPETQNAPADPEVEPTRSQPVVPGVSPGRA